MALNLFFKIKKKRSAVLNLDKPIQTSMF